MKIRFGDDSADAGAMLSGLTVKIDEIKGTGSQGKPEFSLHLKIVDFKMTSKDAGIDIELDQGREGNLIMKPFNSILRCIFCISISAGICVITAQNTDGIIERFSRFSKRVTWSSLVAEYEQNKVRFFKKYLQVM